MPVDVNGNDVSKVFIPVTGNLGVAPEGTAIPTSAQGAAVPFTLPIAWVRPGLIVEDGGFEWTTEADGDPLEFYQEGFSIPSGLANVTLVVKLAQTDDIVRGIIHGQTPDANGYIEIDGGGTDARYAFFTEEIAKNGWIRRRVCASAGIESVKEDKSERGTVTGYEITFKVARSAALNNKHIGEWLIPPVSETVGTITATSPITAAAAGAVVTLTGTGFFGATAVKFGGVNAPLFIIDSSTTIRATMPAGAAGAANITVVTPAGTTAPFTYARS